MGTFGLGWQAVSTNLPHQRIIFGGDFYFDKLSSQTVKTDLTTNKEQVNSDWGRFPDDSSAFDLNLFTQTEVEVSDDFQPYDTIHRPYFLTINFQKPESVKTYFFNQMHSPYTSLENSSNAERKIFSRHIQIHF